MTPQSRLLSELSTGPLTRRTVFRLLAEEDGGTDAAFNAIVEALSVGAVERCSGPAGSWHAKYRKAGPRTITRPTTRRR